VGVLPIYCANCREVSGRKTHPDVMRVVDNPNGGEGAKPIEQVGGVRFEGRALGVEHCIAITSATKPQSGMK